MTTTPTSISGSASVSPAEAVRPTEARGPKVTYATIEYWSEAEFRYVPVVTHIVGDAQKFFHEAHDPPLVIVRSVRYA